MTKISSGRFDRIKLFLLAGVVGFIIDASLLTLLAVSMDYNIYLSRLASFLTATLVTWQLNRRFAFKWLAGPAKKVQEYGRYFFVQLCGALINLSVFSLFIIFIPRLELIPVIPLFVGAMFAMIFNFAGARYWVFRGEV